MIQKQLEDRYEQFDYYIFKIMESVTGGNFDVLKDNEAFKRATGWLWQFIEDLVREVEEEAFSNGYAHGYVNNDYHGSREEKEMKDFMIWYKKKGIKYLQELRETIKQKKNDNN